jgi:hypothetical protein
MFGCRPGSDDGAKTLCGTFRAFFGHYFYAEEKLHSSYARGFGNKSENLTAWLKNSLKDYLHLCIRRKYINDTIARTDCKSIGLLSGWDKRKSGLSGIRVEYLNFGLGPNASQAGPGEIPKFQPVQICNEKELHELCGILETRRVVSHLC